MAGGGGCAGRAAQAHWAREACEEGPGGSGSQEEAGAVMGRLEASAGMGFRGEFHFLRGLMAQEC